MFKCYEVWKCDFDEAVDHMEENFPEAVMSINRQYDTTHADWCAHGNVIATFYEGTLNVYS